MSATAMNMMPAVGQTVAVRMDDLKVDCLVKDVKHVWGQYRLQVQPVAGSGLAWVDIGRIVEVKAETALAIR